MKFLPKSVNIQILVPLLISSNRYSSVWDKATVADGDLLIVITWASMLLSTTLLGMARSSTFVLQYFGCLNCSPLADLYISALCGAMWPTNVTRSLWITSSIFSGADIITWISSIALGFGIRDPLQCCGFYCTLRATSPSKWCYLRAPLPGCKWNPYNFEHQNRSLGEFPSPWSFCTCLI